MAPVPLGRPVPRGGEAEPFSHARDEFVARVREGGAGPRGGGGGEGRRGGRDRAPVVVEARRRRGGRRRARGVEPQALGAGARRRRRGGRAREGGENWKLAARYLWCSRCSAMSLYEAAPKQG